MNAPQLPTTQILRQPATVEPIRFDFLAWSFGNHRGRGHQALIALGRKPVIQSVAARSSLIDKGNLLVDKMLAHMFNQVLRTVGHVQRSYEPSLVIAKRHRDTFLIYVQAGKHVIVLWYERFLSHAECLLAQCLLVSGIVPEHSRSW